MYIIIYLYKYTHSQTLSAVLSSLHIKHACMPLIHASHLKSPSGTLLNPKQPTNTINDNLMHQRYIYYATLTSMK